MQEYPYIQESQQPVQDLEQEAENLEPQYSQTLDDSDIENLDEHFNENVSVDDVFGIQEEPQKTPSKPAIQFNHMSFEQRPHIAPFTPPVTPVVKKQDITKPQTIQTAKEEKVTEPTTQIIEEPQNQSYYNAPQTYHPEPEPYQQYSIEPEQEPEEEYAEEIEEIEEIEEVKDVNQTQDTTNKNDNNIIQDSFDLTPTKSLYLVNYEGTSALMASVKDEYFVLKRFDEIINSPLIVRKSEKNTKKTTYIVRVGYYRAVVEVTMKNIELVLEL